MLSQKNGVPVVIDNIIAGEPYGYRRRARLSLYFDKRSQTVQMGFRQVASSGELVTVMQCPVLKPELNALIPHLHQLLNSLQVARRLGHVELVLADNGPLLVLRHLDALSRADKEKLEQFSHNNHVALFLAPDSDALLQVNGELPFYRINDLTLTFSPRDFIQVNGELNEKMVNQALVWLDIQPEDWLLDLFCGMGNFTLPAGKQVKNVTGVEGVATLVGQAVRNAEKNNLNNVDFFSIIWTRM